MGAPTTDDDAEFEAWKKARNQAILQKWRDEARAEYDKSKNEPTAPIVEPVKNSLNTELQALRVELEAIRAAYEENKRETNLDQAEYCRKFHTLRSENEALQVKLATEKANKRPIDEKLDAILACLTKPPATAFFL